MLNSKSRKMEFSLSFSDEKFCSCEDYVWRLCTLFVFVIWLKIVVATAKESFGTKIQQQSLNFPNMPRILHFDDASDVAQIDASIERSII